MVRSSKGIRARTRTIFRRSCRERGLSPITRLLQKFESGETAHIVIDSSIHKGQPHPRYHGLTGKVVGMQGTAYVIAIKDGRKTKKLIVTAPHLRKCKS